MRKIQARDVVNIFWENSLGEKSFDFGEVTAMPDDGDGLIHFTTASGVVMAMNPHHPPFSHMALIEAEDEEELKRKAEEAPAEKEK